MWMWNTLFGSDGNDSTKAATSVQFTLNGTLMTVGSDVGPEMTLAVYIREVAHLTGTKTSCEEGFCGACVVAAKIVHPVTLQPETFAVNTCLVPVLACHGWEVTTVEGIGDKSTNYHPIQATLANFNGTQCGFCSPGMVMNMFSLMQEGTPTMAEVEDSFGGNLCRCTGYRSILDAFKSLAKDATPKLKSGACGDIEDLHKICSKTGEKCSGKCSTRVLVPLRATENWVKATSLNDIFAVFNAIGDAPYKLVAGNTSEGIYKSGTNMAAYIDVRDVSEMRGATWSATKLTLGANTPLSEAQRLFRNTQDPNFAYLHQIATYIGKIANVPVNNIASIAGNLMMKKEHAEFMSDVFLFLEAAGATLNIRDSSGGTTSLSPLAFLGSDMRKKVLVNLTLPSRDSSFRFALFKVLKRTQCTTAHVNAGFLVQFANTSTWQVIGQPRLIFGGINPTFTHAIDTEAYLVGKNLLDPATVSGALEVLDNELQTDHVLPDADPAFRKSLAQALYYKFLLGLDPSKVRPEYRSGAAEIERPLSSGQQDFQTDETLWPLNEPIPRLDAVLQCSGEAQYVDDLAEHPGELHGAFVITTVASGVIARVDTSAAEAMEGFVAFYSHIDIPGPNTFTPTDVFTFVENEEIFCSGVVKYAGQVVGIVVATSKTIALAAASAVNIEYSKVERPIVSADQVILTTRQHLQNKFARERLWKKMAPRAQHELTGEFDIGRQAHFAMESHSCVVVPTEDGVDVYSSTQWMDLVQVTVARTLQIPVNSVNVHVRRIGGGFGGKQSRPSILTAACAVAAKKLKKPVRLVLPLVHNMEVMGKRFAQKHEYEVGFDDAGKIEYVNSNITQDSGCSKNESALSIAFYFFPSCYVAQNYDFKGEEVLTNTPSNTPCRGPGPIEGIAFHEEIMERVAKFLKKDPLEVKMVNMLKENNPLPVLIQELKQQADYDARKLAADRFNTENRWKKRGMSILPMRYPQSIWANFSSLVCIYHADGTIGITHGGIEMGQGVNTKVSQVAAHTLKVPLSTIKINPSTTITAPNAMLSGGSIVSEGASYATMMACQELLRRLEPVKAGMNNPTWAELVHEAYLQNVDLSATYMFSNKDDLQNYDIWGVTIGEVEVDVLTGEKQVLRVDLVEDVGRSLSPLVDVGQIEGAFVMGLGYWLSEEIMHDPVTGRLLNNRTLNYHLPGAKDIPADFRVHFRKDSPNMTGVLGSKTTGEPAICMSAVVWFAIRNALEAARKDAQATDDYFLMKHPANNENIFFASLTDPSQFQL